MPIIYINSFVFLAALAATLDLQFADTKTLTDQVSNNNLVTFTRASSGTYVGSNGLIQTAATNTSRFDHDPVTGESLGLLIEEARTNFVSDSQEFDQWTLNGTSAVTPDQATAPDGTQTADLIAVDPGGPNHVINFVTISSGTDFAYSIYFKNVDINQFSVRVFRTGADALINIETTNYTQLNTSSFGSVKVEDAGNGWKRVILQYNNPNNNGVTDVRIGGSTSGGATSGSFYAWGAQVEEGTFETSYIPTTTSTATRAADVAEITGANFGFHNAPEGAYVIETGASSGTTSAQARGFVVSDGTNFIEWLPTSRLQTPSTYSSRWCFSYSSC